MGQCMDYKELLEKYNLLLDENSRLIQENNRLKSQLGITICSSAGYRFAGPNEEENSLDDEPNRNTSFSRVHNGSDSISKIRLFMSLFKGRTDVYAKKWQNKKKATLGYSPVCLNLWKDGLCGKPNAPCSKCTNQLYAPLDGHVIESHLRGSVVVGIYPMLSDETCHFLAMDFDEAGWEDDVSTVREVCTEFDIPVAVERSQSGKGGHLWFFFKNPLPAGIARKFGAAILTFSMNKRHEIHFKSYDRLFPSQDTIPKGGFGNLIALPLQKYARQKNHSEFVDERFESYNDQWSFLSSIQKISEDRIENLIQKLCNGQELGFLKIDEEDPPKPWEKQTVKLQVSDFPKQIEIVKANMLFIPKSDISQRALNRLKRLASFKNPMFYRQQAMRLSTYGQSPIISCAEETKEYLCLPRGCEMDLTAELEQYGAEVYLIDKTHCGKRIDVKFNGYLRDEQPFALEQLLHHDTGILSGTTAFGKTVVAINLIAERKVNTLILVDRISLLKQWQERLSQFLIIHETPLKPAVTTENRRGRKKNISAIGHLGAGKSSLRGIIDIAVMQSLSRKGEVKDCVKDYGMIIADECHHASAFSYESILKTTNARYIYGLTATPTRKDGHHPILFMHCGPIRYRDNAKKQAEKRPFDHSVIPRFTSFRIPLNGYEKELSIQEIYAEAVHNEARNQQIVEDVIDNYKRGRNCLILTLRTAHVELLAERLKEEVPDVVTLMGGMGSKKTREVFDRITDTPADKNLILVATGSFIGEGFDEPRLDTLFLAMPISWKGTLQQYAGRLHRLFTDKKEVQIYDYVDIHVRMLERMYQKRLTGYASMGYKAKCEDMLSASLDIIFDKDSFLPVFSNDLAGAKKEIVIVSPFLRKRRTIQMIQPLRVALDKGIRTIVVTRPPEGFKDKDRIALQQALEVLKGHKLSVILKPRIHQKFAIIDQKTVWYGSINLLSYGNAQESIMRLESSNIANELIKSIESP